MQPPTKKLFRKRLAAILPAASALALAILLAASGVTTALDRLWFDTLQRGFAPSAPVPEKTAIVLVDEQSLRTLGNDPYAMRWPWPRRAFAGLFAALERAGAKHIVADFIFFEHSAESVDDALLGSTAAALRPVSLGAMKNSGDGSGRPALPIVWPAEFREKYASYFSGPKPRWGWVDVVQDSDGVIRRYSPDGSLAASADKKTGEKNADEIFFLRWRGGLEQLKARGVPVISAAPFVTTGLNMLNQASAIEPNFDNPEAFGRALQKLPALTGGVFDKVAGCTVIIGANAAGSFDVVATPVNAPEPGALVHWTALADMHEGTFVHDTGRALAFVFLIIVVLFVAVNTRKGNVPADGCRSPWRPVLSALFAVLVVAGGSVAMFVFANAWMAPANAVAGAVMAFGAETTAGFLHERARKREIESWFGAYVSPAVVKNLMRDPSSINLGGERRELSVLFSDIAGFTTISEKLPSERLVTLVNTYLEELSESVLGHGCYLDKYIGDAIMAVFGAPEELENHALHACRAALDSMKRLLTVNTKIEREYNVRLGIRIGVNTGNMVVGNVGSEKKKNYTVLGDAVNLAARLEGANKEFGTTILIGPRTAALVAGKMALRPVAMLRVKGKQESVTVYELLGELDTLTEAQAMHMQACKDGFEAWCARRFDAAASAYAHAAMLRSDDIASINYHEAALQFLKSPPPKDWVPVLELHSK